ncbi:MAG: tRNA uridine-5-carboxymethylaminomethyl(34) synthesis enzyme MnmG [Bacteroidales bacterium]|jgi:tRNA uridine 5-carboxymethylaminomethyl modification enzyme|nr:tRNA uridine-5-carboxymethylaminomethyl(34) synthesis enzyme MnmG [Bacteroidales bacterium]
MQTQYDIIIVGGGHAGCEAAHAAATLSAKTLLISMNIDRLAQMSCNPAMGGVAKGQIVREIDAMGGLSGIVTDHTMIQFRMLNRSKGPAMWSPRVQSDMELFSQKWRELLENTPNLDLRQDEVVDLIVENERVRGIITATGQKFFSKAVILTNGTFLNGIIHIGEKNFSGGRMGEKASFGITERLQSLGFETSRLKTGTPVRVDGRTIDFSKLEEQPGDENPEKFSFLKTPKLTHQRSCYLGYTSEAVHDILRTGFEKSPMFQGRIQGVGPRYCPSIEDKINRFADKTQHQLFVEPQGWVTNEFYINGFSSSLPEEVQIAALHKVRGFEQAKVFRPGYAIEYDYFPPTQLKPTLETKLINGLFHAGQINGTTGYEEAGAQGLMAGINAVMQIRGEEPVVLKRNEAYIGVLIDDLVTKGVDEPYRMFTSRAEYRILLRQDNADQRLTPRSYQLGLASSERMQILEKKQHLTNEFVEYLKQTKIAPEIINPILETCETSDVSQKTSLAQILSRPQIELHNLQPLLTFDFGNADTDLISETQEQAEILIKYDSYIQKEKDIAEKLSKHEDTILKDDFDYHKLQSLSFEAREKLSKIRPRTIGQASRISGVSPADIAVLIIYLSK